MKHIFSETIQMDAYYSYNEEQTKIMILKG